MTKSELRMTKVGREAKLTINEFVIISDLDILNF